MSSEQNFASKSLMRHLVRGAVGFGTLIGSVALIPLVGPASLLLAPIGLLAFRGCPTCWAIGLAQTVSMGRLQRTCIDGRCELRHADRTRGADDQGDGVADADRAGEGHADRLAASQP